MSAWPVKTLRPGIVGMRGSNSYGSTTTATQELSTPPPPLLQHAFGPGLQTYVPWFDYRRKACDTLFTPPEGVFFYYSLLAVGPRGIVGGGSRRRARENADPRRSRNQGKVGEARHNYRKGGR